MASCGNCSHNSVAQPSAPLFEIRRGYQARWNDLAFRVESEPGGWGLHVLDATKRELYAAHRVGPQAAQVAAAEYAIFRVLGPASAMNADRLARELSWQAYW